MQIPLRRFWQGCPLLGATLETEKIHLGVLGFAMAFEISVLNHISKITIILAKKI
jgi:hypothetical protein